MEQSTINFPVQCKGWNDLAQTLGLNNFQIFESFWIKNYFKDLILITGYISL